MRAGQVRSTEQKFVHADDLPAKLSSMFSSVATKDPAAVAAEVQAVYHAMFPEGNPQFVSQVFGWATEVFGGGLADYQPIDARYHDFEHTLQGTLCMARLLHGRHLAAAQPPLTQRLFELGIAAILLHDTGYLKRRDDTTGTGAKYTVTHVSRSVEFAEVLLAGKGFRPGEIHTVQSMIRCTGLDAALAQIPFQSAAERMAGHALGTADLLGQMAADDYVDKLPVLYEEFAEAKRFTPHQTHFVDTFTSAEDLLQKTPAFWDNYVRSKLDREFSGLYRFLNQPFPTGANWYVDRIEQNIQRLRRQLANGLPD